MKVISAVTAVFLLRFTPLITLLNQNDSLFIAVVQSTRKQYLLRVVEVLACFLKLFDKGTLVKSVLSANTFFFLTLHWFINVFKKESYILYSCFLLSDYNVQLHFVFPCAKVNIWSDLMWSWSISKWHRRLLILVSSIPMHHLSVLFPCIICQSSAVSDRISCFACLQAKAVEVAEPKPTTAEDVGPRHCGLEAAAADCTDIRWVQISDSNLG